MLDGLEAVEIKLSTTINDVGIFRIDAEHYKKEYLKIKNVLANHNCELLSSLVSQAISTGHTPSMANEKFYGGSIKFIKTDNLRDNYIKPDFSHFLSELGNNEIKRTALKVDDIIVTIIGATQEIIGRATKVNQEVLPANINQNIALIRLNSQKISPDYLNIYLNSFYGRNYLYYLSRQTEQVNLNCEEIGRLQVPLFSEDFQKNIEQFVKSSHQKLEKSKKLYREAEELLLGELGLKDFEPSRDSVAVRSFADSFGASGRLDAEYYQPKYDQIIAKIKSYKGGFDVLQNHFTQNKTPYEKVKETYDYIEISDVNVSNGAITPNKVLTEDLPDNAKIKVSKGDVLVSKVRPYRGAVGIIELENEDLICSGAFTVLSENGNINKETLVVLFRLPCYRELLLKYNVGTSYPVIKDEDVLNMPLPLIYDKIQKTIAEKINKSFELRSESKQLLEQAKKAVEDAIEKGEFELKVPTDRMQKALDELAAKKGKKFDSMDALKKDLLS